MRQGMYKIGNKISFCICGINIDDITYEELSEHMKLKIARGEKTTITYANADTINRTYKNPEIAGELNSFDIVHPDGIGIFLALKILFGKKGLSKRFTGSDFYPYLIDLAVKNKYSFFFFGEDDAVISGIKTRLPNINICGSHNGYGFQTGEVVSGINSSRTDILIVGLGRGKQEKWILTNIHKLNCKIIIAVGEGIREFAGKKNRGPVFLRKMGLEWFVRFLFNPVKHFKRYIIGNPLFLCRIITLKLRNLRQ